MNLRKLIIAGAGILILILGMMAQRAMVASKKTTERTPPPAAVRAVETVTVENRDRVPQSEFLGRVNAQDRVELFAEVSGQLLPGAQPFREGVRYNKGATMFRIDDAEARYNLVAQKSAFLNAVTASLPDIRLDFPDRFSTWESFAASIELSAPLPELPEVQDQKEKFFLSNRNIFNQYYSIASAQARLDKYRITAPYRGVVSEALINEGTLVRVGQKMGTLIADGAFEVEGALPRDAAGQVKPGDRVVLHLENGDGLEATIARKGEYIDPSTQSTRIFVNANSPALQEGMYLSGTIQSEPVAHCMVVDNDWLQNEYILYLVEATSDSTYALQTAEVLVKHRGEQQSLVSGLPQGALLLAERLSGAHEGQPVNLRQR